MLQLNIPEVVAEVRAAFERYDAGWMRMTSRCWTTASGTIR